MVLAPFCLLEVRRAESDSRLAVHSTVLLKRHLK
jgi:hypothetical protein